MSAAGASTSQQTRSNEKRMYDVCLQWLLDGTYLLHTTDEDLCVDPESGDVYGPSFKERLETGDIPVSWQMVKNGEHRPPTWVCIKICSIDEDKLENFKKAILSFDRDVETFRLEGDKNPGSFMLHAWKYVWLHGALDKPQYDAGANIFRSCAVRDEGWPVTEMGRARYLATMNGGMWYEMDGKGERAGALRFLNEKPVRFDPETKEVIFYQGR